MHWFASIVLAFTAGMGFSSSVLENFHLASPYRIMAVIVGLGLVITNLLGILLLYIDKIRTVSEEKVKYPLIAFRLDLFIK